MSKRILLAEASDTIRGVATTVLRQNGLKVISVGTAQKAMEVLNHTRPSLLIVGGTLADPDGSLFYERVSADHRFASTPILLFAEPGQPRLPFPSEAVINLPFDPKEFVDRVTALTDPLQTPPGSPQSPSAETTNPLGGTGLEDDAINAALGLDRIEVTDSEVMDKTRTGRTVKLKVPEKMVGYDHVDNTDTDMTDSSRVESIIIEDESADIAPAESTPRVRPDPAASGKLDILNASDQYGMSNPDQPGPGVADRTHDYEWFINEMQQEAKSQPPTATPSALRQPELTIAEPSSFVDPITQPPDSAAGSQPPSSGEAVEKFIDEFKKEVEKIHDSEPESILVEANQQSTDVDHNWEDSLEKITPDQIELFTKEFVTVLSERIAAQVAAKIDEEKLLALLKSEIMAQAARKK